MPAACCSCCPWVQGSTAWQQGLWHSCSGLREHLNRSSSSSSLAATAAAAAAAAAAVVGAHMAAVAAAAVDMEQKPAAAAAVAAAAVVGVYSGRAVLNHQGLLICIHDYI